MSTEHGGGEAAAGDQRAGGAAPGQAGTAPAGRPGSGTPGAAGADGAEAGHAQDPRTRRRIRIAAIAIASLLVVAGTVWFMTWLLIGRFHVVTDDAYAGGDQIQVNALVAGTVRSIAADDTDQVAAGQLLVELDTSDADLEVGFASAELGVAVRAVRQLQAEARRAGAQAVLAALDERRAGEDLSRRSDGSRDGTLSREEVEHAEIAVAESEAARAAAEAAHAALSAQVGRTTLALHPQVEQAAAHLRMALLAQQRTRITAPRAGMVARRLVQVGQRVQPGQPLMSIIALDRLWVDANFKESQLRGVEAGQAATVHADLYGSRITYHARVEGLEAGTGAAFALLPAQNATGNWIKIVQRLPVRLTLDPSELLRHPLRIGLSLSVDIGIGEERRAGAGAPPAAQDRELRSMVPAGLAREAEGIITRIIEQQGAQDAELPLTTAGPAADVRTRTPAPAVADIP